MRAGNLVRPSAGLPHGTFPQFAPPQPACTAGCCAQQPSEQEGKQPFRSHTPCPLACIMGHESPPKTLYQADEQTLVATAPQASQDRPREQAP